MAERARGGRRFGWRHVAALALLALGPGTASAEKPEATPWPDTFLARVQVLALMQTLSAEILASPTATRALERWCAAHDLAADPRVSIRPLAVPEIAATAEQRARLGAGARERVAFRSVELRCGETVLSRAENWYLPDRLPRAMQHELATTDTPFGRVVQPLSPYRRTVSAQLLWQPLPPGWERLAPANDVSSKALEIPQALFEHRAVVYSGKHVPLAEVHEVYQRDVLGSGPVRHDAPAAADGTKPPPDLTDARPAWLAELIASIEREPVTSPPSRIERLQYRGRTVYYRSARCCDVPSELYDAAGTVLCHPDGALAGRSAGDCPDFATTRGPGELVWRDLRSH